MRKPCLTEKALPSTDPKRRRLLLALGLSASGGLALARAGGPRAGQNCDLLSLREADFYHRHDLAG